MSLPFGSPGHNDPVHKFWVVKSVMALNAGLSLGKIQPLLDLGMRLGYDRHGPREPRACLDLGCAGAGRRYPALRVRRVGIHTPDASVPLRAEGVVNGLAARLQLRNHKQGRQGQGQCVKVRVRITMYVRVRARV